MCANCFSWRSANNFKTSGGCRSSPRHVTTHRIAQVETHAILLELDEALKRARTREELLALKARVDKDLWVPAAELDGATLRDLKLRDVRPRHC